MSNNYTIINYYEYNTITYLQSWILCRKYSGSPTGNEIIVNNITLLT